MFKNICETPSPRTRTTVTLLDKILITIISKSITYESLIPFLKIQFWNLKQVKTVTQEQYFAGEDKIDYLPE